MNYDGILLGALSFLLIGIWHPIVVKGEYYFGKRLCSFVFSIVGVLFTAGSLFLESTYASVSAALFGFASLWSVKEVIEQEERVQKGWFPRNPNRK